MQNNIGPVLALEECGNYFTSYECGCIAVIESIKDFPKRTIALFKPTKDGLEEAEKLCDDLNDGKL